MSLAQLLGIPALDNTLGALYIGVVVAGGLWGIGTAQAYWYAITYPKDPPFWKTLVAVIWRVVPPGSCARGLTDIQVLRYHSPGHDLPAAVPLPDLVPLCGQNYFNPENLDKPTWSFYIQCLFEMLPAMMVQLFFAMRIWRLSKGKWYLLILPIFFIFAKLALNLAWVIKCSSATSVSDANFRYSTLSELINGAAAGADILLAGTMVYLLHASRTGIRQSDNLITRLMTYTINTGVLVSVWSIITLIFSVLYPRTMIYGAFYFCIGRLYVNTFLASLNARAALKGTSTYVEMSLTASDGRGGKVELPSHIQSDSTKQASHSFHLKLT
ncbi:hypothetical protein NLJ89_g6687 [Agrocybe chaxingu]|uniref:DUF6534 domain-containing protein n=1 Tax=Agrocybe chaxingu TaxID=84603 RepID=A0A9W8MUE6_9AGAR|nr:hypothetical protein NLJ89_g6687 [Agrocybe chaxingu]